MRKENVDNMLKTIKTEDLTATFDDTPELRNQVFERVLEFFKKHETFCGESICQCDGPIIEAHQVFADLADEVFKFAVDWEEEY